MESEFREFPFWLWDRNSLYWHENIQIKFRTFWCHFHILYANESREIKNYENKTGTSMQRFGNASHDDIQKLMDKSENNTTKATATWMNVYHA